MFSGTLQNGATFAIGFVTSGNGQAFSLDGVDDFVSFPAFPAFPVLGISTMDMWIKTTAAF